MSGEIAVARSDPVIVASVVVASVAVTVCALVAIAWMAGWLPVKSGAPSTPVVAAPPSQPARGASDIPLAPGETLVAAPEPLKAAPEAARPGGPTTPQYARVPDRLPSPATTAAPSPAPLTASPLPAPAKPAPIPPSVTRAKPAPAPPAYARAPLPPLTSYERSARSLCVNCGSVTSIRSSDGDWEVRVKFEDGSSETLRYPERPRFRLGDRVHMEDGRLLPD